MSAYYRIMTELERLDALLEAAERNVATATSATLEQCIEKCRTAEALIRSSRDLVASLTKGNLT